MTDDRRRRLASVQAGAGRHRAAAAAALVLACTWMTSIGTLAAPRPARLALADVPGPSLSYIDGAPPGFAGGFGENTCGACHFEADTNTPPGQVTLTGVPDTFVPGDRYQLVVRLDRAGMLRGGFQLSARASPSGVQAGTLAPGDGQDGRVKVERQSDVEYVNQRKEGALGTSSGTFEWSLTWTAPDVPAGTVVQFHVAANAADNDETAEGDFVFTTTIETRAER